MGNIAGILLKYKKYKIPVIKDIAIEENALIMSFTESHLNENILDAEISIDNYSLFRGDRSEGVKKGGVLLYVRNDIAKSARTLCHGSIGLIEYICVYIKEKNLLTITVYRSPQSKLNDFKTVIEIIDKSIESLAPNYPDIIINGDFNFRYIKWANGEALNQSTSCSSQNIFLNFINTHNLTQLVDRPTRLNNTLDLMLTNNEDIVTQIETRDHPSLSDHRLIVATTILSPANDGTQKHSASKSDSFRSLNFYHKNVNWVTLDKEIMDTKWIESFDENSIEESYNFFCSKLLELCQKHIPKKNKRRNRTHIPRDRKILMKKRSVIQKKIQSCHPRNKSRLLLCLENIEQSIIQSHEEENYNIEKKAIENIKRNPKYFYSYARSKSKTKTQIGPFEKEGTIITDPPEKAEILRNQFDSVFESSNMLDYPEIELDALSENSLNDIIISESDIETKIKELRPSAAAGPDEIPALLLKNCANSLKVPLCMLFKKSLSSGIIPKLLKTGIITPLYKGGDRTKPQNYRPVSLTSHVIKIFEKIVRDKLISHINLSNQFNENQHGFRSGRSCVSQLLSHYNNIMEGLENGHDVDVIYLDFAKAFDKVHHGILIRKLQKLNVSGKILAWLTNFLQGRKQQVSVEGSLSRESIVTSGVPQGTVLGPILFLIHINDIDDKAKDCKISCFADDTRIMKTIKTNDDRIVLQNNLDSIYEWAISNKMKFNSNKFEMIDYHERERPNDYHEYKTSDGHPIQRKQQVKDLGVLMSCDATYSENIAFMVKKAKRQSNWILRSFQSRDSTLMLTLLKALVIPLTEYCCQVWSPSKIGEIQKLEDVQRYFTRRINGMDNKNYWERLKTLELYSLERRRERYFIIYIWKIINHIVPNIQGENEIRTYYNNDRLGLRCRIPKLNHRTMDRIKTCKENSLVIKGPKLWNCIPSKIRICLGNFETFKSRLDKFLMTVPDQPVLPGREYSQRAASNSLIDQISTMNTDSRAARRVADSTHGEDQVV